MLQIILFFPLGLFFLLISIDTSLYFIDKASLQDDIRAGLGSFLKATQYATALRVDLKGELQLNRDGIKSLSTHLGENIWKESSKSIWYDKLFDELICEVIPIELNFARYTGKILTWNILESESWEKGQSQANAIEAHVEAKKIIEKISTKSPNRPSPYAVLQGLSNSKRQFQTRLVVFFIRVIAKPRLVGASYSEKILGKELYIHIKDIFSPGEVSI